MTERQTVDEGSYASMWTRRIRTIESGDAFNGSSGSGDVTAEVVYANYGRLEDFDQLAAQHIDLHGKIVLARYGGCSRGEGYIANSAARPEC